MIWIAPSEKDNDNTALEKRLWDAADQFRANSGLKSQEYSPPVLGLVFLRFAEVRFAAQRAKLEKSSVSARRGPRVDESVAFKVNTVDTAMRVSACSHPEGTLQDLPARQDHERLKDMVGPARCLPFGLPRTDNATATRVMGSEF